MKKNKNVSEIAKRYFVWGRVQGVGYRAFAVSAGRESGARGWARNLDDGRVEVYAAGSPEALSDLEGKLRRGPWLADVRGMEAVEDVVDADLDGFHIRS